jgi:hypothetical protein
MPTSVPHPEVDGASGGGPDWDAAGKYLSSLFDPNLSLVTHAAGSASFFATDDNVLAAVAFNYLPTPDPTKRDAIFGRLKLIRVCGCSYQPGHDGTINHFIDPVVSQGAQIPLIPYPGIAGYTRSVVNLTDNCGSAGALCSAVRDVDHPPHWSGDACNGVTVMHGPFTDFETPGMGKGYADIIALEIMNYRNRNMSADKLWSELMAKWDGKGLNDAPFATHATYTVRNLALFKLAANVLGKALPPAVDGLLIGAQDADGGFRSGYDASGAYTPNSSAADTTALVAISFLKPVGDF